MPTTRRLRSILANKLEELFQLDHPVLDFGFYRIKLNKTQEVPCNDNYSLTSSTTIRMQHCAPLLCACVRTVPVILFLGFRTGLFHSLTFARELHNDRVLHQAINRSRRCHRVLENAIPCGNATRKSTTPDD
jgi:hypothetical protein